MANQYLFRPGGNTESNVAKLWLEFPVGASGAVGTVVRSRGFAATPVVRNSAGNYTASLAEAWNAVVAARVDVIDSAASTGNARSAMITVRTPGGSSPLVTFQCLDETGAAADPRNGATVVLSLELQNGTRV